MILISSCLCGEKCKYSGGDNYCQKVMDLTRKEAVLKVCPEVFGGLSTPRLPSEIVGGTAEDVLACRAKVINQAGEDVTAYFTRGAQMVLNLAKQNGIQKAIFKANSPSCGKGYIYDGRFDQKLIEGNGITTQVLLNEGIEVITEKDIK